jgi:hypothetical protein
MKIVYNSKFFVAKRLHDVQDRLRQHDKQDELIIIHIIPRSDPTYPVICDDEEAPHYVILN